MIKVEVDIKMPKIDFGKLFPPEAVEELLVQEGTIITSFAKELAPVLTGQLKNSIMMTTEYVDKGFNEGGGAQPAPDSAKLSIPDDANTAYVGSNLEYAGAVEEGRSDQPNYPAQPYLRPAVAYSEGVRVTRRKRWIEDRLRKAENA